MGTPFSDQMLNLDVKKAIMGKVTPKALSSAISKSLDFKSPVSGGHVDPTPPPFKDVAKMVLMQDNESRAQYARDRFAELRSRKSEIGHEREALDKEQNIDQAKLAAVEKTLGWSEGTFAVERPTGSLFHKLKECWLAKDTLCDEPATATPFFSQEPHIFIIEHDWAKAFADAEDFDGGDWPLPYDRCVFEFQISGKRIIVLSMLADGQGILSAICMHLGGSYWSISAFGDMGIPPSPPTAKEPEDMLYRVNLILHQNVRALCIALDAECAVTQVTRAPHRLNSVRERQGKIALSDFHTVNLAHRSRVEALPSHGEGPAHHKRLHFRRGHWRHYQNHKTWIRWCLCGDPDLGFIDKQYRA